MSKKSESLKSRTYYGTYSLKKWIDLMLSGNIVLPEYQRYFIWNEEQARSFLKSISDRMYVPSVTIAMYNVGSGNRAKADDNSRNLILDGQQRLTTLLLAYLGIFPNKFKVEGSLKDEFQYAPDIQEWNYTKLLDGTNNSKVEILGRINKVHYSQFDINKDFHDERFLNDHFIDFAYIVPQSTQSMEQVNTFFANVFFSINSGGTRLTRFECRKALYSLGENLNDVFEPEFSANIMVNKRRIDLVRLIALASNYYKVGKDKMSKGYDAENAREPLYDEFIRDYISGSLKFSDKFADVSNLPNRVAELNRTMEMLQLKIDSSSIIKADIYYAGIVFYVIVKGKSIREDCGETLKEDLDKCFEEIYNIDYHRKNPGVLKYLRERFDKSIDIYKHYCNE